MHSGRIIFGRSVATVRKVLNLIYSLLSLSNDFKVKKFEMYQILGKSHIQIVNIIQIIRYAATTTFGSLKNYLTEKDSGGKTFLYIPNLYNNKIYKIAAARC